MQIAKEAKPEQGESLPRPMVVGIGASAGGLAALQAFFETVAPDLGVAFVVIVHLHPDYPSEMATLLAARTRMPVLQVREPLPLEPNHVYVIPPNQQLIATDNQLSLLAFTEPRGQRAPIDQFFRSLAETHGDGFGVVLSGSGSDGTSGLKAIKEYGGVVLVQDPKEAEYAAMPRSVIMSGLADLVLPVRELAARLPALIQAKLRFQRGATSLAQREEEALYQILAYLYHRLSHDFSQYKRSTVLRRLSRRLQVTGQTSLHEYLTFLRTNAKEAQVLFQDLLISVTTFFRDPAAFEALAQEVIPLLCLNLNAHAPLRVWVAGCATGEEAYSLAILFIEYLAAHDLYLDLQIFASDLDEVALATAREGRYPHAIKADVTEERLHRFFIKEGQYYRVKKEVRDRVVFANHSLFRDPPFSQLDLIACRNVLIYLERDLQKQVFATFNYALRPNHYLFLGHSESVEGASDLFRTVNKEYRIFQSRGIKSRAPSLTTQVLPAHLTQPAPVRMTGTGGRRDADLHQQALMQAQPSLLVDEHYTVLHLLGNVGRYLQQRDGQFTNSVNALVRPEFQIELEAALLYAFEQNRSSFSAPMLVPLNGTPTPVILTIHPFQRAEDGARLALIAFVEGKVHQPQERTASSEAVDLSAFQQLQADLQQAYARIASMREEHNFAMEELRATNEELLSINEEYLSTAEELETSKEELQSSNEELQTVNTELKSRLDEIAHAHSDLQNFMTATEVGTLFLDLELRIKRFTPGISNLFNIVETDLGRSLTDFTHRLDYPLLAQDAQTVIAQLIPLERQIRSHQDRWYLIRMRPYRTVENKIDGLVLTLVDVTERWQAEESLRQSEERYRLLVESVQEYAIFMLNPAGQITSWNTGAERLFYYQESEIIEQPLSLLFTEADRAAGAYEAELETARRTGQAADERWHQRKDASLFWASGMLTAIYSWNGQLRGFVKILRDNTLQKQAEDRLRILNEELEAQVQKRTEQVRSLASTLTLAEQAERQRIAQILHDDLQQQLYAIQMRLLSLDEGITPAGEERQQRRQEAYDWLAEAIRLTRQLTVDLSPPVLNNEGLTSAIAWLVRQMAELNHLQVEVQATQEFNMKHEGLRVLLFQIVRELLFNVVKHAGTNQATVELREAEDNQLQILVTDKGHGFDVTQAEQAHTGGFGLFSVRERLALLGGHLDIHSVPGDGTQVRITVPTTLAGQLTKETATEI